MKKTDFLLLKKWFSTHVAGFYRGDPVYDEPLILKEKHTERVCGIIDAIGRGMGMDQTAMPMARTIALLHDIGRFIQYETHQTFNDDISRNHAVLGLSEIARHKALAGVEKTEKKIILTSIFYHNAAALPKLDETSLFFAKLIRDADKLDILAIFADYYPHRARRPNPVIELNLPDEPGYCRKILSDISQKKSALKKDVKTLNDFKLLQISWVFDLNFPPSFQILEQSRLIEKIEAELPRTDDIKEAMKTVFSHIKQNRSAP